MSFFCPDITTDSGAQIANNCDQDTAITLLKRIFSDEFIDAYITGNENPALVTGVNTVIGSALSVLGGVAITAACIITILGIYKWITESANDGEAVGLSERGGLMGIFGRPLFALSMLAPTASGLPIINIIIMTVALWSNSIANQMYFKFIDRYTAVPKPSAELYNNSAFKNANDMLKPTLYGALIGYCTKVANIKIPGANLKMYIKAPDTSIANVQKFPYLYKDLGMGFGGARNLCGGYTDINYLEDYYVGDGRSTLMFGALSSNLNVTDDRIEAIVDDLQEIRKKNSKVNYLVVQKRREYAKSAFYQGFMTAFGVTGNSVFTYAHNFLSGNIRTSGNYGTGWNVDVGNPSATDLPNEATLIRTAEDHTRGLNDQVDRILGENVSPELAQKSKELQARLALSGWLNAGTTQSILRKYSSQSATGIFQRPYEVFYSTGIKSEETKDNAYLNDFVTISDLAKEKIVGSVNESGAVNSEMAVQDNIEKLVDNPKSLTGLYESTGNATLAPLSTLNQTAVNALIGTGQDDQDDALYRIQSTGETIIMAAVATKTVLMVVDSNIKLTKMATRIGSVVIGTIPFLDAAQKGEAIANTIGDGESFLDKWILAPALALAEDFMKIGKTLSVTIPVMPYFFLLLAAIGWVVQIIQTSFGMPLWLIMHAVPDRSFIGSQQQGYVTLIALLFRPALILAGFYVSFVLYDPILTFYTTGFWQVQATLAGGSATNSVSEMLIYLGTLYYYWLVFCAGLMMITYYIFGLTQELSDGVLNWLGTNLLQSFGNLNTTSTMQGAASKINAAGSGIAAKRAALAEKSKAKRNKNKDDKDDDDGKDDKDPASENANSEKTSDGDVPLKSDLSSDEKSMTNNLNPVAAADLAKQSLDEEGKKGGAEGGNAEDDPMKTLSDELNKLDTTGIIKDDKDVSDTFGGSDISATTSGEVGGSSADDSNPDAEQSSNQAKGIMGLDSMSEDAQTAINNAFSSIPETGTPSSTQDIELDNGSTVKASYDADGNLASVTATEGSATATQFADGSMTVTDNNADTSRQYEQDSQGSATDSITDNNTGETTVTSSALAADGTRVPVEQTVTDSDGNVVSSTSFAAGALGAAALGGAAMAGARLASGNPLSDSANTARSASASALSQVSSTGTPSSTQDVALTEGSTVQAAYDADGNLASVTATEGSATATQFADGSSRVNDNTADSAREYTENAQGLGTDKVTDNNTGETTVTSSALAADGTRVPVGRTVTDSDGNVISSNNFAASALGAAALGGAAIASSRLSDSANAARSASASALSQVSSTGTPSSTQDVTLTDGSTVKASYGADGSLASVTAKEGSATATQFADGSSRVTDNTADSAREYTENAQGLGTDRLTDNNTGETTVTSSALAADGTRVPVGQTVTDSNGDVVSSNNFAAGDPSGNGLTNPSTALAGSAALAGASVNPAVAASALAAMTGAKLASAKPSQEAKSVASKGLSGFNPEAPQDGSVVRKADGTSMSMPKQNSDGSTSTAKYNANGQLDSVTTAKTANGNTAIATQFANGEMRLAETKSNGDKTDYHEKADGSSVSSAFNAATGQTVTTSVAAHTGATTQTVKDANGNVVASSESKATNALAGVAGAGMVARELAANSLTNIPSTAAANSTDITQANGVTRIANYNDQGKLASVTQKADDGNGRPVSVTRNSDGTVKLDQSNGSEQRSVTRNADGSTSAASSNSATGISSTGYTNPTGDSSRQDIKNAQGVTLSSIAINRLSNGQTETVETTPSSKTFRNNDATGGGYTEKSFAVDPQGNVSATPTSVTQATVANGITTATTTDLATNNQIVSETKPNGDATVRSFTNTPSGLQETAAVSTAVGTDGSKTTSSFALNEAGVMARTSTVTQSPMVGGKADITVANANGQVVASGSVAQSGGATTTTLTDKATGQVSTRSDFADGTGTEVVKSNGQVISRAAYATTSTNRSVSSTADRSGVTISAAKDGSYTAQHVASGATPSYAQGGYVVSNNASPNTVTALAQVVGSATSSHSASAAAHAMSSLVQQQAIAHAGSLPAGAVTTIAGNAHTGTIAATLAHTDGTKTQASYSQGKFTFANPGSAPQQASVTLDPQGGGMTINMAQEGSSTPNQIRFNQNGSFVQSSEVNGKSVTTEGFIGSQDYTRTTTSPATPVSPAAKEVVNHTENQGRQSSVIQTYVGDKLTPDSKAHVVVDTNQGIQTANLSMSNGTLVHSTTDLQANTTDTQVSLHGTKFEPATATESAGTPKVKGNGFMALKSLKEIIASLKP